jgi:hypothetical protein
MQNRHAAQSYIKDLQHVLVELRRLFLFLRVGTGIRMGEEERMKEERRTRNGREVKEKCLNFCVFIP